MSECIISRYNTLDILKPYPIGSIYMSISDTSPASLFGGTWESINDVFLLGSGTTYTNGSTGGKAAHTLTVDEMPSHNHYIYRDNFLKLSVIFSAGTASTESFILSEANYNNLHISNSGLSQPHNNMPPYLTVNIWKRIE